MLTIQIADTSIPYLEAIETEAHWAGSARRVLTITLAPTAIGVDSLNSLLTPANLGAITMTNTNAGTDAAGEAVAVTNIYEGYVLKLACGLQSTLILPETPDAPAVYEDRLVVKLGKPTYIEQQLAALGVGV